MPQVPQFQMHPLASITHCHERRREEKGSDADLGDITGGLVNSFEDWSDLARIGCFISQAIQADVPSSLDNMFSSASLTEGLGLVDTMLIPALAMQYGKTFPGAQFMTSGPRGPRGGYVGW